MLPPGSRLLILDIWKEKSQVYYYLSAIDTQYYLYALDALTKATKLAPTDAVSFYMLGDFYARINATDQAIENYQTAITLKSNYDYAYFALGQIYLSQKKYDLAKTDFEKTLEIAPNNTDPNYLTFIAPNRQALPVERNAVRLGRHEEGRNERIGSVLRFDRVLGVSHLGLVGPRRGRGAEPARGHLREDRSALGHGAAGVRGRRASCASRSNAWKLSFATSGCAAPRRSVLDTR